MDGIDRVAADNVANLHIAAYLAVAVATVSRSNVAGLITLTHVGSVFRLGRGISFSLCQMKFAFCSIAGCLCPTLPTSWRGMLMMLSN